MKNTILSPNQIRARLLERLGNRFNPILQERSGKSSAWVSRHISGTLKTKEGRKLIARAAGVKLRQIFPDK